ncbi:MAG: aldehyde dehydrogenase family protein [Acidimicrobiales bacterium]
MDRISHWIGGAAVAGTSGRTGVVWNPATGVQSAEVDLASTDEVAAAVAVAKDAQRGWRATGLSRRAEVMFRLRDLIDANKKDLADIISAEHGKVPSDALGEIARGLENVEYACGIPNLLKGGYPSRPPASTCTASASPSAWWPGSRRSTSRPWSRCGCWPTRWRAATRSS